jgi:hypothetical protein
MCHVFRKKFKGGEDGNTFLAKITTKMTTSKNDDIKKANKNDDIEKMTTLAGKNSNKKKTLNTEGCIYGKRAPTPSPRGIGGID